MWGRVQEQKGRQKTQSKAGGFLKQRVRNGRREIHGMQLRLKETSEGGGRGVKGGVVYSNCQLTCDS